MLDRSRFMIGDAAWEKVAPLLPGKPTDPGATGKDNRLFLEAVLWRVRTGVPAVARPARRVRQGEQRLPAVPPLGQGRRVRARLRAPVLPTWSPPLDSKGPSAHDFGRILYAASHS